MSDQVNLTSDFSDEELNLLFLGCKIMEKLAAEDIRNNTDKDKTNNLHQFLDDVSALKSKIYGLIQ